MTERERTIKALECCAHVAHMCKECPMDDLRRDRREDPVRSDAPSGQ